MSERSRETGSDQAQLRLLTSPGRHPEWVLDERTRRTGLQGVAAARAALRNARPPEPKHTEPVRKAS